jgi:hypothetical protein
MTLKHWLVGAAGALAVGTLSASVQAAPLGTARDNLKAAANENTVVQDVVWVRRCWWHHGHRHCRRVWSDGPYYYDPGYYYDPYPYGGFFYGPSIGFRFDGGHRHHRGHGHHHGGRGHRHR